MFVSLKLPAVRPSTIGKRAVILWVDTILPPETLPIDFDGVKKDFLVLLSDTSDCDQIFLIQLHFNVHLAIPIVFGKSRLAGKLFALFSHPNELDFEVPLQNHYENGRR
jgi:hypothetical protein